MGVPKQKWNAEEEAALKAGVDKYGAGKWSTILKDPAFGTILRLRSNVDLKDKWRNLNVYASGSGSRQRGRGPSKNNQLILKSDDKSMSPSTESNIEIDDAMPPTSGGLLQICGSKKPIARLENLIIEAISRLKEPRGSSRANIASYIEEHYEAPENLEKLLAPSLKLLTETEKLIKVKHQYRIAPTPQAFQVREEPSTPLMLEAKHDSPRVVEPTPIRVLTRAIVDEELEQMRNMTAMEAAAVAAQAVAEAEAAVAAAEAATKEAEDAEREAELARAFAEAALKTTKHEPPKFWLKMH